MVAVLETRRLMRTGLVCLAIALVVGACASEAATRRVVQEPTPTPTPFSRLDQGVDATRWGYHPAEATGQRDPAPVALELPAGYRVERYAEGLTLPTALAFTPDGRVLVTEQGGAVRIVEGGVLRPEPFYVADVYRPEDVLELGLTGIAVDPLFAENGHVYLYYSTATPERRTVLARVRDAGGAGTDLEEVLSLGANPYCCHIAGGLEFAPDGTLFVSIGDHQFERSAQNRLNVFGSIIRIERNGDAPLDNPLVGHGDPRIYAYGLRNPFGMTLDPATGQLFAAENGYVGQDAILQIEPGGNYGWPGYELDVPLDGVAQPDLFFHETIGPAGMEYYPEGPLAELTGKLLFCQYRGNALRVVGRTGDGGLADEGILARGCSSGITTGPDGFVYFLDIVEGAINRIVRD